MAPIHLNHFERRDWDHGKTFTVVFALVAGTVVIGCLFWGFILPHLRKKYFPLPPSRTVHNTFPRFWWRQAFSSEVTLIANTSRRYNRRVDRAHPVTIYDPNIHSPFPGRVQRQIYRENIALPDWAPRSPATPSPAVLTERHAFIHRSLATVAPVVLSNQNIFTPVRNRNLTSEGPQTPGPSSLSVPRIRSRVQEISSESDDFGDAREYIRALPEPLRFRSRENERRLMTSTIDNALPSSSQASTSADKHMHPNKLFAQLENREKEEEEGEEEDSEYSDISLTSTVDEARTESYHESATSTAQGQDEREDDQAFRPLDEPNPEENIPDHMHGIFAPTPPPSASEPVDEEAEHNASITAMHRLRTYRSLVGAAAIEPLTRAGTLTRPQNTVARLRVMYDEIPTNNTNNSAITSIASGNGTISTIARNMTDCSEGAATPSSAISPNNNNKTLPEASTPSRASLLPTPLRLQRTQQSPNLYQTTDENTDNESIHALPVITSVRRGRGMLGNNNNTTTTTGISTNTILTVSPRSAPLRTILETRPRAGALSSFHSPLLSPAAASSPPISGDDDGADVVVVNNNNTVASRNHRSTVSTISTEIAPSEARLSDGVGPISASEGRDIVRGGEDWL